jgi:hypothetical protein
VIASVLALMEGADPAKAYLLAVFQDTQETRVSDTPHIGRRYLDAGWWRHVVTASRKERCQVLVVDVDPVQVELDLRQDRLACPRRAPLVGKRGWAGRPPVGIVRAALKSSPGGETRERSIQWVLPLSFMVGRLT